MRRRWALSLIVLAALCGCHDPASRPGFEHYTGIALCPSAAIRDLTSREERDTLLGFSFHLQVALDPACDREFRSRLASICPGECTDDRIRTVGCFIEDVRKGRGAPRTSLMVEPLAAGRYDLRLWK